MTVHYLPAPEPSFVERFRDQWRAGDYVDCMTGASFMPREVQNECIVAAVEMKREAQERGTSFEALREMDVAIRMMGEVAAVALTSFERARLTRLFS